MVLLPATQAWHKSGGGGGGGGGSEGSGSHRSLCARTVQKCGAAVGNVHEPSSTSVQEPSSQMELYAGESGSVQPSGPVAVWSGWQRPVDPPRVPNLPLLWC